MAHKKVKLQKGLEVDKDEVVQEKGTLLLWIKNLPAYMTENDVRCLSEEIVGIRREELKDATVQLTKVLIGYENEETTFQNYERLKEKNVNGIDLDVQRVRLSSAVVYIPTILTSEEEGLQFRRNWV